MNSAWGVDRHLPKWRQAFAHIRTDSIELDSRLQLRVPLAKYRTYNSPRFAGQAAMLVQLTSALGWLLVLTDLNKAGAADQCASLSNADDFATSFDKYAARIIYEQDR